MEGGIRVAADDTRLAGAGAAGAAGAVFQIVHIIFIVLGDSGDTPVQRFFLYFVIDLSSKTPTFEVLL